MSRYVPLGAAALFLILFFFLPLGIVLHRGIFAGEVPFSKITEVLGSSYYQRIIGFTVFQAVISAFFALLLGLPGAYLLSRSSGKLKSFLRAVATVPFILPAILVVLGFIIFFGNNGFLNRILMTLFKLDSPPLRVLYTFKAVILAHGFYNFPVVLRIVSGAWENMPENEKDAAAAMGAGKYRIFRTVVLPRLFPSIAVSWFLTFLFCYLSFAVILVLAGGPQYTTMEVEIYRLTVRAVELDNAAALGAVQAVLTLVMMSAFTHFTSKGRITGSSGISYAAGRETAAEKKKKEKYSAIKKAALIIYSALALMVLLGPIVSLVIRSFQTPITRAGGIQFTLKWYREIFSGTGSPLKAMANTLFYAISTAAISLVIGVFLARMIWRSVRGRKILESLSLLPLGISSVVLGLGYLLILRRIPGQIVSPLLVIAAHSIIAYPFVLGTVRSYLSKIPSNINHAARLLGASPVRAFRTVEFPLIQPGIAAAGSFAFAISAGEMNATIMFNSAGVVTLPIMIYRYVGAYNYYGACALGVILMVLSATAFFAADYFSEEGRKYVSSS